MGFNNRASRPRRAPAEHGDGGGILGLNIGKNFDTPNERAVDDYLACLRAVYAAADYVAVNISSPNTKGLRDLQAEDAMPRSRRAEGGAGEARHSTARHCRSR